MLDAVPFSLWSLSVNAGAEYSCLVRLTPTRRLELYSTLLQALDSVSIVDQCILLSIHLLTCFTLVVNHSVFGEDALVNVSVEKKDDNDGKLAGYIRIRSKTQGIALSLGDRITSVQRGLPETKQ